MTALQPREGLKTQNCHAMKRSAQGSMVALVVTLAMVGKFLIAGEFTIFDYHIFIDKMTKKMPKKRDKITLP